jgi:hypothetical protein
LGFLLKDGAGHPRRFLGEHLTFRLPKFVFLEEPLALWCVKTAAHEPLAVGRAKLRLELAEEGSNQPDIAIR